MNLYRVTFHANNGVCFNTILMAKNLGSLKSEIFKRIKNEEYFEVENKNNKRFLVQSETLPFIETELLFAEEGIKLEDLKNCDSNDLKRIVNDIESMNVLVVAFSLNDSEDDFKQRVINCLTEEKRKEYEEETKNLWEVTLSEVVEARKMIIDAAHKLQMNNDIGKIIVS